MRVLAPGPSTARGQGRSDQRRGALRRVKLNLGSGAHPLDGFENLDAENGWRFQDGLGAYDDASVEAISISHALYLLPLADWPAAFAEFARVLAPGGVLRVTEDATDDRRSVRYGGFHDAVTLTSADLVITHMEVAGFKRAAKVPPWSTGYRDGSLVQQHHGKPPKVFHVEAVKP